MGESAGYVVVGVGWLVGCRLVCERAAASFIQRGSKGCHQRQWHSFQERPAALVAVGGGFICQRRQRLCVVVVGSIGCRRRQRLHSLEEPAGYVVVRVSSGFIHWGSQRDRLLLNESASFVRGSGIHCWRKWLHLPEEAAAPSAEAVADVGCQRVQRLWSSLEAASSVGGGSIGRCWRWLHLLE